MKSLFSIGLCGLIAKMVNRITRQKYQIEHILLEFYHAQIKQNKIQKNIKGGH